MRALTYIASLVVLIIICSAIALSAEAPTETTASKLAAQYRTATAYLVVKGSSETGEQVTKSGTGFIVSDDGYAITAAHLFQDKDRKPLLLRSGARSTFA
jgi:hypothetical protein